MAEQLDMPASIKQHLLEGMIGKRIGDLTVTRVLGYGNTAVTYEAEDKYTIPWALKLVTVESYGNRAPFREVARFSHTRDARFLVFPQDAGDWSFEAAGAEHDFLWFRSRCVSGMTLKEFLASGQPFHLRSEVLRYMECLSVALAELARLGFSHGDLHAGNIMREVAGEGGSLPEIQYVIIDFSEAYPAEKADEGLSEDIENFAAQLRKFSEAVHLRETLSREDEGVLAAIAHVPGLPGLGALRPGDVVERFKDGLRSTDEAPRKLRSPFDSLSAEYIANDALLADLCFKNVWWTAELEKNNNVLLIGPRGCGKTMLFRRLRLKTKITAGKTQEEIANDQYLGFYLPFESLYFMRFSELTGADISQHRAALILFFNMAALSEISSALALLPAPLGPTPRVLASAVAAVFREELDFLWQELAFPTVVASMDELATLAERVMRYIRKAVAYGHPVPRGSTDFTSRVVKTIKMEFPAVAGRHFIFFLDDYTEERVPIPLQQALHPIVCQRSADMCFKISAHMFGSIYSYPQPLALDEGRNIMVIHLGAAYLKLQGKKEGRFLLQILDERFRHCEGYSGTIQDWLGGTSYPGGVALGRALHEAKRPAQVYYHGVDCLIDLCTGDYSEMIRMVGEIFREAGIVPKREAQNDEDVGVLKPSGTIPPAVQHRAITKLSREFLGKIRKIRPDGQKLFDVVSSFGLLSRNLLYYRKPVGQGKDRKGRPRQDPYDLLTIYVDNLTKAPQWTGKVWERLQRAAIFVDVGLAPSQRTVVADRVTLRRIYCPSFRTMLSSSEHLQATKDQFVWFMDEPEKFCEKYFQKVTGMGAQPGLWKEQGPERPPESEEQIAVHFADPRDCRDFAAQAPSAWSDAAAALPPLVPVAEALEGGACFDLFIGAIGFEERTTAAIEAAVARRVRARRVALFEFDRYYEATERRRPKYEEYALALTDGKPYRPFNAPVGAPDPIFAEGFRSMLTTERPKGPFRVLFDCTSCPSLIHSQALAVLLDSTCDLTVLYSEAADYFPKRDEWEKKKTVAHGLRIQGPFAGVNYLAKPGILQADDIGERPLLLVLFPTFNKERTADLLGELDPAARIWLFGEPHDVRRHAFRIEMAKSFASPVMCPGDLWSLVPTFDYRRTLAALGGIYGANRLKYRLAVMPHGSKMHTLATGLFAAAHEVSMVFAMPKTYNPERYSAGVAAVWAIPLGDTADLLNRLRAKRVLGSEDRTLAARSTEA